LARSAIISRRGCHFFRFTDDYRVLTLCTQAVGR
jgi:hypothetical protein